jgi:hypothetical protein
VAVQSTPAPIEVDPETLDVHTTLEYRMDAEFAGWLPLGVLAIFCGLFIFAIEQPGLPSSGKVMFAAAAGIACGLIITVLALWRRFRPGRPLYVLSPDGIHIRWPLIKEILVPWREIKGVDTIDIPLRHWFWRSYLGTTSVGATVFVVSNEFYDANNHLDSFILRGPGWLNTFVVRGDLVQCALHPQPVWADPRLLRKAVEERWLAFRDRPATPLKPRTASVPSVIAGALKRKPRDDAAATAPRVMMASIKPRRFSTWEWVKIALPAIGIVIAGSNLLGLWRTDAQTAAYERRKAAAQERARYERERKEFNDMMEKRRKEHDELMRRTFGQ